MRARYKGPAGTGIIELPDSATVQELLNELQTRTGFVSFTVKYGPPMAMKSLDLSLAGETARSVGLHGETLTIVPAEAPPAPIRPLEAKEPRQAAPQSHSNIEDINIPWREREGTLSFGGALPQQIPAQRLRMMMSDYITEHSDTYTEAVLGQAPRQYCRSIQDPDRWGGGIELSILSAIFDIQICTFDVQAQNLINFGEEKRDRCILVYSGIHYDRVAFSYSDFPHTITSLPPDMDRSLWPTTDEEVLQKTKELVRKLHMAHYYTDTEGLILKCDVPGCDWIGSGQVEGRKHAEQTGHIDLSEIRDVEGDSVLHSCNARGCDFMGQGDRAMRQHTSDTGHEGFSIIPDW
ncbi:hypothetical protein BGZ63DRAFT_509537 [Mariannaea sp. PMI_226]|nr:hypothetical protein BGZ63DRAFT_509537 [Mariannaea sp. PMI_226]